MRKGQIVRLIPCGSKLRELNNEVLLMLELLTEDVELLLLTHISGNAKVRDKKGVVFFCNPADLSLVDTVN